MWYNANRDLFEPQLIVILLDLCITSMEMFKPILE